MRIQLIGLGNVGRSLIELIENRKEFLRSLGFDITIVSVSDSKGTAVDEKGLDLHEILEQKKLGWKSFHKYVKGYTALEAIRKVESDAVVELTPSASGGEPGLSYIKAALMARKNVVTSNKAPLVVAYHDLMKTAEDNGVQLLCEATVAAHVPVFCLINSCFRVDELLKVQGVLNATTNFIIGEIEKGRSFQEALKEAIRGGWAETKYSDDVDGVDPARKLVILANSLFRKHVKLEDVNVKGIRNIETMVKRAQKSKKKVKLLCEITKDKDKLKMSVAPKQIPLDDPLATVNQGNMGIKFTFKTSKEVFVSAQFTSPTQTAYAVLNDMIKTNSPKPSCPSNLLYHARKSSEREHACTVKRFFR